MSYGPGDPQTMGYFERQYLEGTYDADRAIAKQEWQQAVNDWEDGVSDVEPPAFEDWY